MFAAATVTDIYASLMVGLITMTNFSGLLFYTFILLYYSIKLNLEILKATV